MVKVVVAGCGFGGIDVAVAVKRQLGKDARVLAINKDPYHTLNGSLPEIISGKLKPEDINVPLGPYFRVFGVEFLADAITSIDPQKKRLHTQDHGDIDFDYLVLDLGNIPCDFGIPGINEHAFTIKPVDRCVRLARHIQEQFKQYTRRSSQENLTGLTFIVGGGGFSGIEVITEIADLCDDLCRAYGVPPTVVSLNLVDVLPQLGGAFGKRTSKKLHAYMARRNIRLLLGKKITKVEADGIYLDDIHIPTNTFVWAGGFKTHPLLADSGFTCDRGGAVLVNQFLQVPEYPYIFASGDCSSVEDPHTHKQVGKTALMAVVEEPVIVNNIVASVRDTRLQPFKPKRQYAYYLTLGQDTAMWMYGTWSCVGRWCFRRKKRIHTTYAKKYFDALDPAKKDIVRRESRNITWGG